MRLYALLAALGSCCACAPVIPLDGPDVARGPSNGPVADAAPREAAVVSDASGGDAVPDVYVVTAPPPACTLGDPQACYGGPELTAGVGTCHRGVRECLPTRVWSVCRGEVRPEPERCDGLDNDCDGVVDNGIDVQTDPRNCGGCGRACEAPYLYCARGVCQRDPPRPADAGPACLPTEQACGGTCVPLDDVTHCGDCTTVCYGAIPALRQHNTCTAGRCGIACDPGFGDCDGDPSNGCETNLQRSSANCGACGHACGPSQLCLVGECR